MLSSVIAVMAAEGAPVSKPNKEQDTPLHLAARAEALVALRALVLAGADVTARNSKNRWEKLQDHVGCVMLHMATCTLRHNWMPNMIADLRSGCDNFGSGACMMQHSVRWGQPTPALCQQQCSSC